MMLRIMDIGKTDSQSNLGRSVLVIKGSITF